MHFILNYLDYIHTEMNLKGDSMSETGKRLGRFILKFTFPIALEHVVIFQHILAQILYSHFLFWNFLISYLFAMSVL